jgi:hypothetical protein
MNPVIAAEGIVTVIEVEEFAVIGACTPPMTTVSELGTEVLKLVPVIVMEVPVNPLEAERLLIVGDTAPGIGVVFGVIVQELGVEESVG